MVPLIESLVDAFETRRLSRRDLVASLAALVAIPDSASPHTPAVQLHSQDTHGAPPNHLSLGFQDVGRPALFYR